MREGDGPDDRRGEHRHDWRRRRRAPPWWPEGEAFPPRHGAHGYWKGPPRRMVRRFVAVVALFLVVVVTTSVGAVLVIAEVVGAQRGAVAATVVALGGGALLTTVLVAGARTARRWAVPLGDVMAAADRVAAGDLDARVRPRGPAEVRRLAASFNAMAERLTGDEARRRELLADLAHELRTPLTGIRGAVEAMLDGVRPTGPQQLGVILDRTTAMERLLDDLATLSTAEAGALRLHRESTPVRTLVEDAVRAFTDAAAADGVHLSGDVAPTLPPLDVDPVRIGQVLGNLVTNALRHTPPGGTVTVRADLGDVGDVHGVVLSVNDTGRGIERDDAGRVFDRFARASDSGGAGLGLPIARSLVEAHGGEIALTSTPGAGTNVRFVVPLDGDR